MNKKMSRLFFVLMGLALSIIVLSPQIQAVEQTGVVQFEQARDNSYIQLVLNVPTYDLQDEKLSAEGLSTTYDQPGAPQLPYYTRIVSIPQGYTFTVKMAEDQLNSRTVGMLSPAPTISWDDAVDGNEILVDKQLQSYQPDPAIYTADQLFPAQSYLVSAPFTVENQSYVRVSLFPLRYNPVTQTVVHAQSQKLVLSLMQASGDTRSADSDQPNTIQQAAYFLNAYPKHERTRLPVGQTAYKISVAEDGIYQVTADQLMAAGLDITTVDPNTIQLLQDGIDVAYQFIGEPNDGFQSGEAIRFYGWAYNGDRTEQQYINENLFWLWVNGQSTQIAASPNQPTGENVPYVQATAKFGEDLIYIPTYTDRWQYFENQPDSWYWMKLDKPATTPALTQTFSLTLPAVANTPNNATFTVELFGEKSQAHLYSAQLVGDATQATADWYGKESINLHLTVPQIRLQEGVNQLAVSDISADKSRAYINQITAQYDRLLIAEDETLAFTHSGFGTYQFNLTGFQDQRPLAWNITNPHRPVAITLESADVTANSADSINYRIAQQQNGTANYLVTSEAKIKTPIAISSYAVNELDAPDRKAKWLAISAAEFIPEVEKLAAHRALPEFGGYTTHIVDVVDIINQYGYGLPSPSGIRNYLAYAHAQWVKPPHYVVLFGDASNNPRELSCPGCSSVWTIDPTYVPTFLLYADRFLGQIPSDHPYTLVAGGDDFPDLSVGRIPVSTLEETHHVVEKIMRYERNQLEPEEWMRNILFVSDNKDSAGDFCAVTRDVSSNVHNSFSNSQYCLPDSPSAEDVTGMRDTILDYVNNKGLTLLNYRGHGSITQWGGGILSATDGALMTNSDRPIVIITADCLDGNFAWTNSNAISESLLRTPQAGTAAHWSSTGLGYLFEYSVMHNAFYEGLQTAGYSAIGDLINYAKMSYLSIGYNPSVLYAMTLQGDPAMQLMRPNMQIDMTPNVTSAIVGEMVQFTVTVTNTGIYPTPIELVNTLPNSFNFVSADTASPHTLTLLDNNRVRLTIPEGLGLNQSMSVVLTAQANSSGVAQQNIIELMGKGLEIQSGTKNAISIINVVSGATAVSLEMQQSFEWLNFRSSLTFGTLLLLVLLTARVMQRRRR